MFYILPIRYSIMYSTPLGNALAYKQIEAATLLITHGANVNSMDGPGYYGESYLHLFKHDIDVVRLLLDYGADANISCINTNYVLMCLACDGDKYIDIIKLLIDYGADLNRQYGGETAIYVAIKYNQVNTLKLLLASGADIDVGDGFIKRQPWNISHECIEVLIDHGLSDDNIDRMLHAAFKRGRSHIIKLFIDKGIDINHIASGGSSLMHLTTNTSTVELLIREGYDINTKDNDGNTRLHTVIKPDYDISLLQGLLANNADINITNNDGHTPLNLAANMGIQSAIITLLDHKDDIEPPLANMPLRSLIYF